MNIGYKCLKLLYNCNSLCSVTARRWKSKRISLPRLPYAYNALEPVLCKEIMELHHKKHHQTYVDNLIAALDRLKQAIRAADITGMVAQEKAIVFNGGGHINHSIFWNNYSPQSSQADGELLALIEDKFGSVARLKKKLVTAANGVQGSGWVWLAYNPHTRCLIITTTANQNPLQPTTGLFPILAIDVWEHSYYLQYLNKRGDYTKKLLSVINWNDVRNRYLDAKCGIVA